MPVQTIHHCITWGNIGPNTHTGENLRTPAPFLGGHKTMNGKLILIDSICVKPTVVLMWPIGALLVWNFFTRLLALVCYIHPPLLTSAAGT